MNNFIIFCMDCMDELLSDARHKCKICGSDDVIDMTDCQEVA